MLSVLLESHIWGMGVVILNDCSFILADGFKRPASQRRGGKAFYSLSHYGTEIQMSHLCTALTVALVDNSSVFFFFALFSHH